MIGVRGAFDLDQDLDNAAEGIGDRRNAGVDVAAEQGIAAVIQPGGSMRDEEAIEAANQHGMAMIFTGLRHFKH